MARGKLPPIKKWSPTNFKRLRKAVGASQEKMGRMVGARQATWSLWESGKSNPSPRNILLLNEAYAKLKEEAEANQGKA